MSAIEQAVKASEARHRAEIRVIIESALDLRTLRRVKSVRDRAMEVFRELGLERRAERNAVLIYVLLAERAVAIIADTGLDARVTPREWQRVEEKIVEGFRANHWLGGVIDGIELATKLLAREFPAAGADGEELPDRPSLL